MKPITFERGDDMKFAIIALAILAVTGFAAERVVTWEYFTQTG